MLNIVLHEPEIPANTGNIGRTCVAAGARLHLIEPLGFQINEKQLKRAGLDYWDKLDVTTYVNFEDFLAKNPGAKIYMATTKARKKYTDVRFEDDEYYYYVKAVPKINVANADVRIKHINAKKTKKTDDIRQMRTGDTAKDNGYAVSNEEDDDILFYDDDK